MALERGIALAAFAIGLAVVVLALFGCGEDSDSDEPVACGSNNSALPVVGARLTPDGASVRFAYAGAEPCSFAADRHRGRLYVELRTNTTLAEVDRRPPLPTGCATGVLEPPIPPDTPVEPIFGNRRLVAADEIRALLAPGAECTGVPRAQPAFVID
jgi:hypothetical protein